VQVGLVEAIILGIVQGLTEFLPISSSGHLILVPWLLGWREHSLTFDLALHLGTALSLLAYFWRDWVRLGLAVFRGVLAADQRRGADWHLAWMLVVASLPAVIVGLLLDKWIEENVRQPWLVAVMLIVFGLVLLYADRARAGGGNPRPVGWVDAVVIGCAQAVAVIPGVSRSGITITAGLLLGLGRADAARFSFLLSAPIIVGAGLYKLRVLLREPIAADSLVAFAAGMIAAAIVGALAIDMLLRHLRTRSVAVFVWYRVIVGVAVLALSLAWR
jgi:undecaprenyl-diphosphatase